MINKIVIICGFIILILILGDIFWGQGEKQAEPGEISLEERELIATWLIENNLNQYGDSKDTVYMGGTPLFNEKTGQRIDRYEYILRNHSDMPWKK